MGTARKLAAIAAVSLLSIDRAQAADPVSKAELYGLAPSKGADRVLDQFKDLLILGERYAGDRPKHLLQEYYYDLKPHGTDVPGLCEAQSVVFHFEPLRLENNSDTPTRLSDVEVTNRRFHFREVPSTPDQEQSMAERASLNAHCRGENPEKYFSGDSVEQVVEGLWLLRALKTQASADNPEFLVNCSAEDRAKCAEEFRTLTASTLASVGPCAPEENKEGFYCLALRGYYTLDIRYTGHERDIKISRIAFYEFVTVGDYREE
jgi:hypothetical protein